MCSIHSAAGEPPWPGWLGKYTLKSFASRSWNASHRPAPPAPCRKRSGGPEPSWSIWTGVPRTTSSRAVGISADEEAAVRREPLPGEERAVVGGEEERRGRNLVRLAGAVQRRAGEHRRPDQRRHPLGHRRVDVARADRVHADPARGDVARDGPRECQNRPLGRAVVRDDLEPGERGDAREVDDRAAVLPAHQPQSLARAEERPVDVYREHPSPRLVA